MLNIAKIRFSLLILSLYTLSGVAQPVLQFEPVPANFGVTNPDAVSAININYDNIDPSKQLFHLFLPDTVNTHPLVVFIHGGGFDGGNPGVVFTDPGRRAEVKFFLDHGFAFASFGYRLISSNPPDSEGVIKSLNDSKRALQFVRYYAQDLHIRPEQIALTGTSAGSGTSLWLGTRSDMADPDATDPVLRESTRVCAVAAGGSQSTYDLYKWETQVFNDFDGQGTNFTLDSIADLMTAQRVMNFYGGLDSIYQVIHDPELIQYRQDVDILFHMSSDDPPVYINNNSRAVHPSDDLFHHAFHGRELNAAALAANLPEVKADIPALSINTTDGETKNEFLIRHLNACAITTGIAEEVSAQPTNPILYPNPAQTHFSIQGLDKKIKTVDIYSFTGKLVSRQQPKDNIISLSKAPLPPGIYAVYITDQSGQRFSSKLMIQ